MKKPETLGELRASGYAPCSVKDELRQNLRQALANGENPFPGVFGYDRTVLPAMHNAILSRHDLLLLGLRGQAKTRLLRSLVNLLDPEIPAIAGSEVNEDPFAPITKYGRRLLAEKGDATPIVWIPRDERYREKLATPDVTIADLIGDIDPIKAATERRSYSDEEVIHFGIMPRTNRGIFAINELPDLQPRIQVGLLNILEERDLQIRGFPVRIPLDILLVFSANPEDYTNRGNIITPLKDRISSQILTHYPDDVKTAAKITAQEAWLDARRRAVRSRSRTSSASSSRKSPSRRAAPSSWTSPRASRRACRSRPSRSSPPTSSAAACATTKRRSRRASATCRRRCPPSRAKSRWSTRASSRAPRSSPRS